MTTRPCLIGTRPPDVLHNEDDQGLDLDYSQEEWNEMMLTYLGKRDRAKQEAKLQTQDIESEGVERACEGEAC